MQIDNDAGNLTYAIRHFFNALCPSFLVFCNESSTFAVKSLT